MSTVAFRAREREREKNLFNATLTIERRGGGKWKTRAYKNFPRIRIPEGLRNVYTAKREMGHVGPFVSPGSAQQQDSQH